MKNKFVSLLGLFVVLGFFDHGCAGDPTTMATSSDGVEINFSMLGNGEPNILLVHGWTNNNSIWDKQVVALSKKYKVIAVDLAGHGKSGNNRVQWSMSAFGEDIAAVVRTANLQHVILVGFSMGGPAILEAAKILPDMVDGLILVDAISNPESQIPQAVIPYIDSTYMDLIESPTAEKAMRLGFFIKNPEESLNKVIAMIDRDQTGWREILHENLRWSNEDCIESLEALAFPLLAINSDHNPTEEIIFKKYIPSFKAKILEGTGHVMMWDVTNEFNQALEESIQEIIRAQGRGGF